jgi:hypothetical protein
MFGTRRTFIPSLLLEEYQISTDSGSTLFMVKGWKLGFINWLLDKLGLKSRNVEFRITHDHIETIDAGKRYERAPIRDLYCMSIGYGRRKIFLVIAGVFVLTALGSFGYYVVQGSYDFPGGRMLFALLGATLYLWLYSRSGRMEFVFQTQTGNQIGVRVKSGVTGKKIGLQDMHAIKDICFALAASSSRFYNGHYTDSVTRVSEMVRVHHETKSAV